MEILLEIGGKSLLVLLWIGSALAVLLGVGLLLAPQLTLRINAYCSRWVDAGKLRVVLDRPLRTERFIYRHHRVSGSLLFAGSVFLLYKLMLDPRRGKLLAAASDPYGLVDAVVAVFVIFAVIGALMGGLIATKPSLLRDLESAANSWVSTEAVMGTFDKTFPGLDNKVLQYRKIFGAVLLFSGAYVFSELRIFI